MSENSSFETILLESKTIAVIGLSDKEERDSNRVGKYLQEQGYKVYPVNPHREQVLGEKSNKSLKELQIGSIDIVVVFRKPEDVPPIIEDAIALKPKLVWLQLGITNSEGMQKLLAAGIVGVEDKCIMVEHRRLKNQL